MGDTRSYAALEWVIGEIGETLNEARQALEAYVEDPKDSTRIRFCLTHIHQVHGTLQMVEFYGASLLAEEMEQLSQALMNNAVSSAGEAHEVLMRSLLQLPVYLDHVKSRRDDHPGVILPLLNDLRAVRKQSYLSETNLFAPDLTPAEQASGQRHPLTSDPKKLQPLLQKLREMYQFAAASILRGVKVEENLGYLEKVCARLEALTQGTRGFVIWNVAAALIEGLQRGDLELSVAVRGLLRHLARELRILTEKSPESLNIPARETLLKNLLYYVARADAGGKRVDSVKQAYQLDAALLYGGVNSRPSDKDFISAPDPDAIRSVVAALQDEIDGIKQTLDVSLTGQGGLDDLTGVLPVVKRIGDTLAVLGIGDLRKQMMAQHDKLEAMCNAGHIDEERLMEVAGKIIEIEHRLQAIAKGAHNSRDFSSVDERGIEIDQAKSTVLAECKKGLEQSKDSIVEYIASKWDPSHLAHVCTLLSHIRGGLEMIPLPRAAEVVQVCGRYIKEQLLDSRATPDWQTLDSLADTIASIDYYLERLADDPEDDLDGLLKIAEDSIAALGYAVEPRQQPVAPDSQPVAEESVEQREEHVADEPVAEGATTESEAELTIDAEAETETADGPDTEPELDGEAEVRFGDDSEIDDDGELVGEGDTEPHLESEPAEREPAESAEEHLATEPEPEEIEELSLDDDVIGEAAQTESAGTAETAAEAAAVVETPPTSPAKAPEPEPAEEESDIDDEIIEIFIEEAAEVQETLAEYFPKWREDADDQDSLVVVRRAFHTLKGSGRMVQAADVGELAWSVENMLNRVIDKTITLQEEHLGLIEMVQDLLPELLKAFEQKQPNPQKELTEQYMGWASAAANGDRPASLLRAVGHWANKDELADQPRRAEEAATKPERHDDADDADDLILWEIFASEAQSHLATVEEFVREMEQVAPLYTPPSDNMQRALHTLKGSAHMAHVTPIAELATPFEAFVKELRAYQVNLNDDILQLIKDGVYYTQQGLLAIEKGDPVQLPRLPQFLARTAELRELAVGPLIRQKERERDGEKQVDPRLLSIFMAEEMKLLLDADQILLRWQKNLSDRTEIDPLVTELTTLQEGANQANLPEMAQLSALLCEIYHRCLTGKLELQEEIFKAMSLGHDVLLDMVDAVAAGQNLQPVKHDLVEELKGFLNSDGAVELEAQSESESEVSAPLDENLDGSFVTDDVVIDEQPLNAEFADAENAGGDAADSSKDFSLDDALEFTAIDEGEADLDNLDLNMDMDTDTDTDTDVESPEASQSEVPQANSPDHLQSESVNDTQPEDSDELAEVRVDLETGDGDLTDSELLREDADLLFSDDATANDYAGLPAVDVDEDYSAADDDFGFEFKSTDTESETGAADADEQRYSDEDLGEDIDLEEDLDSQFSSLSDDVGAELEAFSKEIGDDVEASASDDTFAAAATEPEGSVTTESASPQPEVSTQTHLDKNHEDYDEEIVEIFLEEANELTEELDEAIHEWESDWSNEEPLGVMARALHTLKGGARLAGLTEVGDLTHEYETFLLRQDLEDINQSFFENIQQFQDKLLRVVRGVRAALDGVDLPPSKDVPGTVSTDTSLNDIDPEPASEKSSEQAPTSTPAADDVARDAVSKANILKFAPKSKALADPDDGGDFGVGGAGQRGASQTAAQTAPRRPQEVVKISAELLEELVNLAGETSISRGRLETQVSDLGGAINEIDGTLTRLHEQLRRLDIETEAQVVFRQEQMAEHEEFDPLEMDRYSQLQQLSRSLIESASDLVDLKSTLTDKVKDTETLLLQQSRVNTHLQEGLMRSRMVPFSRLTPRLRRIVRQISSEVGKNVSFELDNVEGEMDRAVLERMVAPLEHMLRNAVDHGIETPEERAKAGKPETGRVVLSLAREGGDVLLRLMDDGRGINLKRVRAKAIERGLMTEDAQLSEQDIMQFILHAGFSTAESVTQISGRGVGMDVVYAEIKQLGGSMTIASRWGEGTEFHVRLPFTVSVNRALMVNLGPDQYAIPLNAIEGIVRISPYELEHYYSDPDARFEYANEQFQVRYLGSMLSDEIRPRLDAQSLPLPVILVRSEQHTMALQVDGLLGSREIVVKALGQQFGAVQGLSGATVMGDGSVVVILDLHALVRKDIALASPAPIYTIEQETERLAKQASDALKTVMIVDDSVTVRKVTTRFLEREGYNVITAKDGVDALQILQDELPDVMLLDIEMPRMDGFEVAKNIRTTSRWKDIPIIMITSRTGEKHRERALSLGVDRYMGKPYQEDALLSNIHELLAK